MSEPSLFLNEILSYSNFMNIKEEFKNQQIQYLINEPLSQHTYYKIGGQCAFYIEPKNITQLQTVIEIIKKNDLQFFILGHGANVLFSDDGYEGIIINLKNFNKKSVEKNIVTCDTGVTLQDFVDYCASLNLTGYAQLSGIPGTLGGALKMNAGAFGVEIYDHILSLRLLDKDNKIIEYLKSNLNTGYRSTVFDDDQIIIDAKFLLLEGKKDELQKIKDETILKREQKQPLDFPSCGSVFKKTSLVPKIQNCPIKIEITEQFNQWRGIPAGVLIEAVGLKGKTIGGAQISSKHGNFILNINNAKAKDILNLINLARKEVYTNTGFILEPEVRLVGLTLDSLE